MILAIDPGNTKSAVVVYSTDGVPESGQILTNDEVLDRLHRGPLVGRVVIEMIASYGMAVGKEVFETCVWIGRFMQTAIDRGMFVHRVFRSEVKMHLCGSMRAKDANIRQALMDRFGGKGTKKEPGKLYGFKADMFAALAVAVTWADKHSPASADASVGTSPGRAEAGLFLQKNP